MADRNEPQPTDADKLLRDKLLADRVLADYLAGDLAPEQRADFERRLKSDDQLRTEVELQSRIDASLAKQFKPPALPESFWADVEQESKRKPEQQQVTPQSVIEERSADSNKNRRTVLTLLAASVVWAFVGWWTFGRNDDEYREIALHEIYEQSVASGFEPKWVCEDDHEFAETFQRRQGQALLLSAIPQGSMVGLSYLPGISRQTTAMLARVEGEPVIVFIDSLDNDTKPDKPSWWSGLHLFRKELDGLVLYEISPLSEPRVFDYFYSTTVSETLPESAPEPAPDPDSDLPTASPATESPENTP